MIKRFVIIQLLAITLVGFSGCETVTGSLNSIESKAIEDKRSQLSNRLAQDGWDVDTLDTARDVDYLNESEKDVILASNSVRTNPAHFGELYVKPVTGTFDGFLMIESNDVRIQTQEGVAAVNELYNQLLRMDNMGIIHSLRTKKDLDEAPGAYKNIFYIMQDQQDLIEIVTELTPLANIKG